jgi:hypothetical protein
MNRGMVDYLQSLNVSQPIFQRVHNVYDFFREMLPEDVDLVELFVTQYITEEGAREYENLWFFSDEYLMEAKDFLTVDEFDTIALNSNVRRWEIRGQDYNYRRATDKSRIFLHITFSDQIGADLRASQKNCDYLMAILKKYFVPNLIPEATK